MEKAKARWRAPRPRRSPQETRIIKRLAWQWFIGEGPRCSLRELARRLGVSQTYCQKLMRQFRANPQNDLESVVRGYGGPSISASGQLQKPRLRILTTFEELREAQEQSERMRAHGLLRPAYARSQRAIPSNSPAFAVGSSTAAWESWMRKAKQRQPKLTGQQILARVIESAVTVAEERISQAGAFWRAGEATDVGEAKLVRRVRQRLVNHGLTALPSAGLRALPPDLAEHIERVLRYRALPKNPPE